MEVNFSSSVQLLQLFTLLNNTGLIGHGVLKKNTLRMRALLPVCYNAAASC